MASYKQLQNLVRGLVDEGSITAKMTKSDLRALYKVATANLSCYNFAHPSPDDMWGQGSRNNERQRDFFAECAKQVFGVKEWPDNSDKRSIKKAAELDLAADDLPYLQQARALGVLEEYRKVSQLKKTRHLPLKFFLEALVEYRSDKDGYPDKDFWKSLYSAASQHRADGCTAVRAHRRSNSFDRFADALYSLKLREDELVVFDKLYCNRHAYELVRKGVITIEFAIDYHRHIDSRWSKLKKLTRNPQWDKLYGSVASALYLGMKPVEIAANYNKLCGGPDSSANLTRAEADHWIRDCINMNDKAARRFTDLSPKRYLAESLGITQTELGHLRDHSRLVLEWYARKKGLAAMSKKRVVYGPGGQERSFCFNDLIDEITEADLGPADAPLGAKLAANPEKVFEAAARRRYDMYLHRLGNNVALPKLNGMTDLPESMQQLVSSTDLLEEGEKMSHCVGGYVESCLRKRSYIYSVRTGSGRSTAEICPDSDGGYRLAQHRSFNNGNPPAENIDVVHAWCLENGIRFTDYSLCRYAA